MPDEDVHALVEKAITDPVFRRSLSRQFDATVQRHDIKLTKKETAALRLVNWDRMLDPTAAKANKWVHIVSKTAGPVI